MLNFNGFIQNVYVLTCTSKHQYLKGPCFHKRRWGRKRILDDCFVTTDLEILYLTWNFLSLNCKPSPYIHAVICLEIMVQY